MAKFVVEQNLLGLLVQDQVFGQPNPFKVAIEFLDKTEGRWDRDNTPAARGILAELDGSWASPPHEGKRWYVSKYFDEQFLTFEQIAQAYELFQATGLWGELIGYYAYVFIPETSYDSPTPSYLPMSKIDVEQLRWREWRNNSEHGGHRRVEGGYTIPLTPNYSYPVSGSILAQLYTMGYTLYTTVNLPAEYVDPPEEP